MGLADGEAFEKEFGAMVCKGSMALRTGCGKCSRCTIEMNNARGRPGQVEETQADQWDESVRGKKMSDTTGRVIFKYQMPVLEQFTMKLPKDAKILRVEDQGGMFWMWALVRTDVPDEERKFHAFKCGGAIPDGLSLRYVGFCAVFVQMELGLYIFEEVKFGWN